MKVSLIRLRNILGLESFEILKPGKLTVISGANETGKTSAIEGIKAILAGGAHDATLLRNGATEGEAVLLLDDGTEIRKKVGVETSALTVTHPDLGKIGAGVGYLKAHFDALSFNPAEFLTAKPERRAEILIESVPMTISSSDLPRGLAQFDGIVKRVARVDFSRHALKVLDEVRSLAYDERTGVNRVAKNSETTAAQIRRTIPVDFTGGQAPREEREAAIAEKAALVAKGKAEIAGVDEWLARKIEELRADAEAQKDKIREIYRHPLDEATKRVAVAEERAESADRLAGSVTMAEEHEKTAEISKGQSERLTAAIEELDRMKLGLLEKLPFSGVEIRDGDIYVEGVPFDRLNTATKVKIIVSLARHRAGDVPFVVFDGLEVLDPKTFKAFRDRITKEEIQVIATRVADEAEIERTGGALTVESYS